MELINNTTKTLKDDLSVEIKKGSKLSIAAACFSIYAFQELKKQLTSIEELRFIFTSPTFVAEKTKKEKREFYIPRLNRERSLYGTEFEIKLRNEMTQKAIAKECADWIKEKVTFKSNISDKTIQGQLVVDDIGYTPINNFTTVELGCEKGNVISTTIVKDQSLAQTLIRDFNEIWNDKKVLQEVTDEVIFAKFGRRAILNLRQTLASKILELEKDSLYNKYIDRVGTVISAEVYQIWKKEMLLLDDEGNELLLPKTEQIPSDFYRKGETARAVVARVDNKNNNPKIILSRTSPVFLQRLFEMEVPEINDGLITIKKIARIPGERAKIAVESYDDRIDPVGACVGVKGSRIHGIVRELRNENIDVINYTSNIQLFIQRALSPAKISSIVLHEEEKKAEVYLKPEEVSLAIGKGGMNIKLASMLTEYTIDVYRELDESAMDEDIYLDEFKDEIDEWVITAIKNIGLDTAKAVLNAPREMLIEKADLEENTVDDVLRVLRAEFEE